MDEQYAISRGNNTIFIIYSGIQKSETTSEHASTSWSVMLIKKKNNNWQKADRKDFYKIQHGL